ncbi:MATH and LRR domain-containing protein PFE0570w isoform X3 [Hydra vulgaris]|uniref:MATH and LRR domain-containing protein PFE0570w isoform X3 n=1 Tax=Hydra vulgaris TaxID=6087 RepID=UPI001F5F0A5E|nr:MATH and LRR domain-containing protein PFE0570w isoform X2 [Hydra vulgaris]
MSNPHVFDELSNRLNKNVNSTASNDLQPCNDVKNTLHDSTGSKQHVNEYVDGKKPEKKKGVIKSLKSFFSKKKKKKSHSDQALNFDSEIKKEDHLNVKSKIDGDTLVLKNESPEKQNSLEKTQQKIRSSLRKLKISKQKPDNDNQKTDDSSGRVENSSLESNSRHPNIIEQSTPAVKKPSIALKPSIRSAENISPIDIDGFSITSTVESSAAKDKIRIAPQNRRKPTRFQSDLSKKPSDEIFSEPENNLSSDVKLEVSKKLFDSVLNTSICNVDGEESFEHSSVAMENVVRSESVEIPKKAGGISVEDIVRTRRTLSTNSRENVPLISVKPCNRSTNSMNNKERVSHSRSLGALNKVTESKSYSNKDGSRAKSERTLNMENEAKEKQSVFEEQNVLKKPTNSSANNDSERSSFFLRELEKDIRSFNVETNNSKTVQNSFKNNDLTQENIHFTCSNGNDVPIKEDLHKKRDSSNYVPVHEDYVKRNPASVVSKDELEKRNSAGYSVPSKDGVGKRISGNYSVSSKEDLGKRNSGNYAVSSKEDLGKRNSGNYKQGFLTKPSCVDPVKSTKKDNDSNKNSFLNESKEKDEFDLHSIVKETVTIGQKDSRFKEDISIIHSRNRSNEAGFQLASPPDSLDFSLKSKQSHPSSKDPNLELSSTSIKPTDVVMERSSVLKKKPSSENLTEKLSGKSSFPLNEIHSTSKFDWTSNSIKSEQDKKQKPLKPNESYKEPIIPEFNRILLKQTPNSKDLLRNSELFNETDMNNTNNDNDSNSSKEPQIIEKSTLNSTLSEKQKSTDLIDTPVSSADLNIVRSKSLSSAEVSRPKLKDNSRDAKSTSWFAANDDDKVEHENFNKGHSAIKDHNVISMMHSSPSEVLK